VASSLLQSRFRGTKARKNFKQKRERADACEKLFFGSVASYKIKMMRKCFSAFVVGLQEKRAAIFLQNRVRGMLARHKIIKEKKKKQRQEQLIAMSLGKGAHVLMRRIFDHLEHCLVEKAVAKIRAIHTTRQQQKDAFFQAIMSTPPAVGPDMNNEESTERVSDMSHEIKQDAVRGNAAETNDTAEAEDIPDKFDFPIPSKDFYNYLQQVHQNGTCLIPLASMKLTQAQYSELFRISRVFICQSPNLRDSDLMAMLYQASYSDLGQPYQRKRTASDMEQRHLQAEIMDTSIIELSLCNNEIGVIAMEALGSGISGNEKTSNGALAYLQTLHLCRNKIGNKGACVLGAALAGACCIKVMMLLLKTILFDVVSFLALFFLYIRI
jgi:hypothetical protein